METSSNNVVQTPISESERAHSANGLRGIVFTALFAALFIAFSFVKIPLWFTAVPITLQTLAVMLAGGLLGTFYGFLSITIVVLLTAAGLPLLGGSGGLPTILGATGGFIWSFPISALLIGYVSDLLFTRKQKLNRIGVLLLFSSLVLFGILLAYISGVPWLAYKAKLSFGMAMQYGCYPFLLGDFVKAAAAVVMISKLRPLLARFR